MLILIPTATALEQQNLRDCLAHLATQIVGHRTWTRGIIGNNTIVLIETGMGAVNTAQALTVALQQLKADLVLQIGIGGAYLTTNLQIGDLALATEENYGDLGVITPDGWHPAEEIGIPILSKDRDYYNTFPIDSDLVAEAYSVLQKSEIDVVSGPFVTVQQCTGRTDVGNELASRFKAICENMEGAAAAQICTLYDVPFLELRAISNRVENRDKDAWDIPLAIERSQLGAQKLIEALK